MTTKKASAQPRTDLCPTLFATMNLPSSRCQPTRQAVVFHGKEHYSAKHYSLKTNPVVARCAGDSTRPLSQGCKLLHKGPNWNASYLTDKTWRTRCQQLLTGNVFLSGKPGAADIYLQRPSTSNMPL